MHYQTDFCQAYDICPNNVLKHFTGSYDFQDGLGVLKPPEHRQSALAKRTGITAKSPDLNYYQKLEDEPEVCEKNIESEILKSYEERLKIPT